MLFTSCVISGYLLLNASSTDNLPLQSFAHADSLILSELKNFSISDKQIHVVQTNIDSNFIRKTYRVRVAPQFSKTQLHAELNKTFYNYSVSTPGKVSFPHKDISIHLEYNNTVIRSIILQSDPNLSITRNRASLLLVFEEVPDNELLTELTSLGEPFPVVLKVENPMQANQLRDEVGKKYPRIIYWLQSRNSGNIFTAGLQEVEAIFKQMKEVMPDAVILRILDSESASDRERRQAVAQSGLSSVRLREPIIFDDNLGKSAFMDKLDTFARQTSSQNHPVAIISADNSIISWLKEHLPELKKNGLEFVPPPVTNN